jgi:hypothetical protein
MLKTATVVRQSFYGRQCELTNAFQLPIRSAEKSSPAQRRSEHQEERVAGLKALAAQLDV